MSIVYSQAVNKAVNRRVNKTVNVYKLFLDVQIAEEWLILAVKLSFQAFGLLEE